MTWTKGDKRWMWRAWSADRERICDCGWLTAANADDARSNARTLLGGPHRYEVVEITVEEIP